MTSSSSYDTSLKYYVCRAGIENISVMFTKPDKRASWEESFNEAKQKLGELSRDYSGIHEVYLVRDIERQHLLR